MFNSTKLTGTVPPQSELYYWADYVELLCLADVDGQFSAQRLAEVAKFADDFEATSRNAQDADHDDIEEMLLDSGGTVSFAAIEEDLALADPTNSNVGIDTDGAGEAETTDIGRAAEEYDNRYDWCAQIFGLLRDRQKSLGVAYPFELEPGSLSIERKENLEDCQMYVFYLSCSSLSYVSTAMMQRLTAQFELVSFHVLRKMLPEPAEVDMYGTARGLGSSRFSGRQYQRLTALARELRGRVLVGASDFHPRDAGDNGLDLVAWIPMHDNAKGVPSFFSQCACGKKWDGKQYEASYERWREFVHLTSPPTKITFIPHHYRRVGEQFYTDGDVSGVLVDRLRAIRLAGEDPMHVPTDLVDQALAFRLPQA